MKPYLGSYRIADTLGLETLLGKPLEGLNVAVIGNAKDLQSSDKRATSLRQVHRDLGNLGISTTDFDLRDTKGVCQVKESLRDFDMAFVTGGNSFVLRKRMQESGFDKAILEIMEKGLAYCGESAGSVVAGKLIASAEVEDIMSVESPVQEGLGLIDRIVIPHANWKRRQEYIDQSLATYGSDILLLRDYDTHIITQ